MVARSLIINIYSNSTLKQKKDTEGTKLYFYFWANILDNKKFMYDKLDFVKVSRK